MVTKNKNPEEINAKKLKNEIREIIENCFGKNATSGEIRRKMWGIDSGFEFHPEFAKKFADTLISKYSNMPYVAAELTSVVRYTLANREHEVIPQQNKALEIMGSENFISTLKQFNEGPKSNLNTAIFLLTTATMSESQEAVDKLAKIILTVAKESPTLFENVFSTYLSISGTELANYINADLSKQNNLKKIKRDDDGQLTLF
ncbi:MAG: hypothetical protein M1122_00910 [Candidatus Marsarchaeota archaeon]|nr:hypothetical protein [Candidatus Marsarchaeota archaeon]